LSGAGEPARACTAIAGTNIALVKYWGKRDAALNLPATGSLSLTLAELGTRTTVRFSAGGAEDQVTLNGAPLNTYQIRVEGMEANNNRLVIRIDQVQPSVESLGRELTRDMRKVNGDLHLSIVPSSFLSGRGPSAAGAAPGGAAGALSGSAVDSVRVLAGNVGYIAFGRIVAPTPTAPSAMDARIRSLRRRR